jgi:hypothetical protein
MSLIRQPRLTRLVLDGLNAALTHAEAMMGPDPETFGPEDWKRQNAAERWLKAQLLRRNLEVEKPPSPVRRGGGPPLPDPSKGQNEGGSK